jgi:hypothetical protein
VFAVVLASAAGAAPVFLGGQFEKRVIADNPLVYYRFEDSQSTNGSTAANSADAGVDDGTYQGGTVHAQGPHGVTALSAPNSQGADFRSSNAYVASTTLGNFGSALGGGFAVEFWINTTDTSGITQPFGTLNSGTTEALVIDLNRNSSLAGQAGATDFYVRDGNGSDLSAHITTDIYDGKWHHLAWIVDDPSTNTMQVFVDGEAQSLTYGRQNSPSTFSDFSFPVYIGAVNNRGTPGSFSNAAMDEVAVYSASITPTDVEQHLAALPHYLESYDGTYAPADTNPPLSQTTWQAFDNISGSDIEPNAGGAIGFARFNDNSGGGRLSIFDTFNDGIEDRAWTYESRVKLDSLSGNLVFLGVRDEGGDGKTVMLGWDPNDGSLGLFSGSGAEFLSVNGADFVDGDFHTYEVLKLGTAGTYSVQVRVDGVPQFGSPIDYSTFPNDVSSINGIGYFSSTPGTSDMTLDYLSLQIVPEPATVALLGLGAIGLWRRRRRNR